jgi:hypothetical protein
MAALIPTRAMIACATLAEGLPAQAAGAALARGLESGGSEDADVFAIEQAGVRGDAMRRLLEQERFDARMLAARALVLLLARLTPEGLAGSLALELATRARQSGVPAYAVCAENRLDAFDERVLDLQCILIAADARALRRAGAELARIL